MRKFDYRHLPASLFDGKVGDANVRLYEDKGKLETLEQLKPDRLEGLHLKAHVESVDASARIEGLYVDRARVAALVDGEAPRDETESQIVGYSNALKLVESREQGLELTAGSIVALFETLYGHRNLGRKSRYRKKDYAYVQMDGHMQAVPVSPITAFETPLVLGGACDSLSDAFDADACSPLILAAVFTVDFLCIRPFDEGNGRIARLFADLMLRKAGFGIAQYASVDARIEKSAMDYYDALNACVDGWDRAANDYAPFVLYWLDAVHETYQALFDDLARQQAGAAGKSERVRAYVLGADAPVSKRQILAAFPDVSEATVENVLGQLVRESAVRKVGAGRSTAYEAS